MKSRYLKLIFFCLYLVLCLGLYEHLFVYHASLNGKDVEVVNVYSEYKDPGINVKLRGRPYKMVREEDNVNTNKLGTYKVKYYFSDMVKERTVEVKDLESPKIVLTGETVILNYKEEYKEPGYEALDNYDGVITHLVKTENNINSEKLGEYSVKYTVKDTSGNKSEVVRKVLVKDTEEPKITFKRGINTYAILGNKIDLNDYSATDNYDGDVTKNVKVDGSVDYNKVGIYNVTYTVNDKSGNTNIVKRTVNVQKKNTTGIPVLMYHWFYDDTKGEKAGSTNSHNYISKTEITKQVKYLSDNNYYYPTWQELIDYIDGKIDLPQKSVIATDDDCRQSFFDVALPVFQEYKVPVTSFCITNKDNYQKYIGEDYLDFESHTDSMHVRSCNTAWDGAVMCAKYEDIYKDIKESINKIKNTNSFAYPFGHYNDNTIKALQENGIKLAFTINNGRVKRNANKYKLPRVRISSWTTINSFKDLVK